MTTPDPAPPRPRQVPRVLTVVVVALALAAATLALVRSRDVEPGPCRGSREIFCVVYPDAFVRTSDGTAVRLVGENLGRGPYRENGSWAPDPLREIDAMGRRGAPAFDVVHIPMDWSYFQHEDGRLDAGAFAELDRYIDHAAAAGLYVVLDPIHVSRPARSACAEEPAMAGAHRNVPAWAWRAVGQEPGTSCDDGDDQGQPWNDALDDVLALPETADYLRAVARRYDAGTSRGRQVVAIDLVDGPQADGPTARAQFQQIRDRAYVPWLADHGPHSVRAVAPHKILLVEPVDGNSSLNGVDLRPLARPNVVMSFHDDFASDRTQRPTSTACNRTQPGYTRTGFLDGRCYESSVSPGSRPPYDPGWVSYADRQVEHRAHLRRILDWLAPPRLPLFIGEFGVLNPCGGGALGPATRYTADTDALYDDLTVVDGGTARTVQVSRTYAAHGRFDAQALRWRGRGPCRLPGADVPPTSYFPYATNVTGGRTRR